MALYRDAKLVSTGYSLGSALATFTCLDFHNLFGRCDEHYTFGEPRVGNENFAMFVQASVPERYRVIHYADIVPHIPPQLPISYAHFSYEIWYDKTMKTYKQCGAEEFKCSKSLFPTSWSTSDHDISNYLKIGQWCLWEGYWIYHNLFINVRLCQTTISATIKTQLPESVSVLLAQAWPPICNSLPSLDACSFTHDEGREDFEMVDQWRR